MPNNKSLLFFAALVVAVGVLLFFARSVADRSPTAAGFWNNTSVACLPFGHQSLAQHFHPTLEITVDGVTEAIPGNIGVSAGCMAEVHTHEANGMLHIESAEAGSTFTIADFFTVWDKPMVREGHALEVRMNGEEASDYASRTLKDGDSIEFVYTSSTTTGDGN